MRFRKIYIVIFVLLFLGIIFLNAYRSIRTFFYKPCPWPGTSLVKSKLPEFGSSKKTVFIIADNKLTELFDMLTPFYLFNATEKANVYIVAKEETPIFIKQDLFVSPQLTFREADSLMLPADVIVLPALSIRDEHQDTTTIAWIKKHFAPQTKMVTICDGASTGAATGFYDGKSITCHATDFDDVKSHFNKPVWVQNVSVAKEGNLFSTAGVSNAVEGSLTVIEELFGSETRKKVAADINYPHEKIMLAHQSIALSGSNKFALAMRVFLKRNRDIGVLLENGINEFTLAGFLDTYSRTFPSSFKTYIVNDSTIQTKYGLTMICSGNKSVTGLDELHVLMPEAFSKEDGLYFKKITTIMYDNREKKYMIDLCLKRIGEQCGHQFEKFVKVSLDYN